MVLDCPWLCCIVYQCCCKSSKSWNSLSITKSWNSSLQNCDLANLILRPRSAISRKAVVCLVVVLWQLSHRKFEINICYITVRASSNNLKAIT